MRWLIGIDDTDSLDSRGTGHRARQLLEGLAAAGATPLGVTRHQLLVHPDIPYTSHNSAACLELEAPAARREWLTAFCRTFLREQSAEGSDAGLCAGPAAAAGGAVAGFGRRAKREIIGEADAHRLAGEHGLLLEGLTGTGLGVIGALAAVGLRASADDGRFLWLPGLRELSGTHRASDLRLRLGLDAVETEAGEPVPDGDRVAVGEWPRPLLRRGRTVFLVEHAEHEDGRWISLSRTRVKALSD